MKLLNALSVFFICLTFSSIGQVKQKTADKLFARMQYSQCVEMYDELTKKCIKEKKSCDYENVRKAGVSHYQLFQMDGAIQHFKHLKSVNQLKEKDAEYYIQALRFTGKYEDASNELKEAFAKFPTNIYFATLIHDQSKFKGLFADSSVFRIAKTNISSAYGDFSPTYYEKGLVYATKSKNTEVINGRYGWDNAYYVSLLQAPFEQDTIVNNGKLLRNKFLSKAHDGPVDFNTEENQMVITKNIIGKQKGKPVVVLALYFSQKLNGKWTELEPFQHNSKEYNVGHGCFSADGMKLYFASDMPGGNGGTDIYVSEREGNFWSKPVNLGSIINTEKNELFPFIFEEQLFFASNGHFGLGGLDLFEANIHSGKVQNLGYPVNSSADDFGLIVDSSGLNGYFSSNRKDAIDKIYSFEKKEIYIDVIVNVFEKYIENEIVPSQPITLKNEVTGEEENYFSDSNGDLHLKVRQNERYTFSTSKEDFKLKNPVELLVEKATKDTTYRCELILLPTKITIALKIVAKDTRKPIDKATGVIYKFNNGKDTTMFTNENGLVTLNVDRNKEYVAHGSKKGFIDDEQVFNTSHQDGKIIELELALTPIKKGEKFKLENIFYDLNKSTLRPESMASLDKLADFILKNDLTIELSAHTDSRGSATYNQKLSQARAQSCVDYLITKGVQTSKIKAKGYGEAQLVNKCKDGVKCTEEEHQDNRRTEVKILDFEKE